MRAILTIASLSVAAMPAAADELDVRITIPHVVSTTTIVTSGRPPPHPPLLPSTHP